MRRLLFLAASAAATAAALSPHPAHSTSDVRLDAASLVARQVGHGGRTGPAPDRVMVLQAWHQAGVDTRGLETPDGLLHNCTVLDLSAPRPAGPAPADYALYRDAAGVDRIGMFLSPSDVAVIDQGRVRIVPRPELSGDVGELTQERLVAQRGSLHACRLAPQRWPGGRDDVSVTPGRITLADPGETAEHLQWAANHPRDADQGLLHPIVRILATIAAGISGILDQVAAAVFDGLHAMFARMGWAGAPFLALGSLLTHSFDGRRLHAILTGVVLAVAVLLTLGTGLWAVPLAWVVLGGVLAGAAASAAGVPVLGAVGGALVGGILAVASFTVGILTGIDDSGRVCVGTVVFALLADVLWVPRLAGAMGHTGALAGALSHVERVPMLRAVVGEGRSVLGVAAHLSDAVALRPSTVARGVRAVDDGIRALDGWLAGRLGVLLPHTAPAATRIVGAEEAVAVGGHRALDLLSLAWRPSSIVSDAVGHAADAAHFLDTELRTGLPSMPRLRRLLLEMDPARREATTAVLRELSTKAVPALRATSHISHAHTGGRALMGIASGQPPSAPWWRLWRSPVRRLTLGRLPD